MTELRKVQIWDSVSDETAYVTDNALDVNVQDQHTQNIDNFMAQGVGSIYVLNTSTLVNGSAFVTTTDPNFLVGEGVLIAEAGAVNETFFANIAASTIGAAPYTTEPDIPVPIGFTTGGAVVRKVIFDMFNESGTRGSPSIFLATNNGTVSFDITRIIVSMTATGTCTMPKFGDIGGGLTNGCVLRKWVNADSHYHNIANWKTNADMANYMFDLDFLDAAGLGATNGLKGRMTFGGQSKHGVVVRLEPSDRLEFLIQDDITTGGIASFKIMVQGHLTDEI